MAQKRNMTRIAAAAVSAHMLLMLAVMLMRALGEPM